MPLAVADLAPAQIILGKNGEVAVIRMRRRAVKAIVEGDGIGRIAQAGEASLEVHQ